MDAPRAEPTSVLLDGPRSVRAGARELLRRSRRFSWLSWGFLFALYGGLFALVLLSVFFPVVTTTTSANGTTTTSTWPEWGLALAIPPPLILAVLAVRELFAARTSTQAALRRAPAPPPPGEEEPLGWTATLVEAQKTVSSARGEVEWSFLPLGLGGVPAGTEGLLLVLQPLVPPGTFLELGVAVVLAAGLALVVWAIYRVARNWVAGFQEILDRAARELSELEAEFVGRFTVPAT